MHLIQQKILKISMSKNIAKLTLREIGQLVGEPHPQKIKHHINQLLKKGFLKQNIDHSLTSPISSNDQNNVFITLPILGSANCGLATRIVDEYPEGYLHISKSMLPNFIPDQFFVIKAIGNSMNKASIHGKHIDDGDYIIINRKNINNYQNKYVLSIINGMANVKKFIMDSINNQIILISESTQDYPPIYIHRSDFQNYMINGVIEDVIKKPH
jgi:SOS-response transcriptional repressor LexA